MIDLAPWLPLLNTALISGVIGAIATFGVERMKDKRTGQKIQVEFLGAETQRIHELLEGHEALAQGLRSRVDALLQEVQYLREENSKLIIQVHELQDEVHQLRREHHES
jgi:uncharacterized coiled-coil DUF342 family protein